LHGFRALKVWMTIKTFRANRLGNVAERSRSFDLNLILVKQVHRRQVSGAKTTQLSAVKDMSGALTVSAFATVYGRNDAGTNPRSTAAPILPHRVV
jgi:hypothetical protein